MQLYGSTSSPYVRRIRIWCHEQEINYDFINLNIFDEKDRATLIELNPTRKIPMLKDGEQVIFDSNVIHRYLQHTFELAPLNWHQENQVTLINACNDSLVEMLICQRSDLDTKQDSLFFNLQNERISEVLSELNQQVANREFTAFDYPEMSLYCLLDWIEFRALTDLMAYPALVQFWKKHQSRASTQKNDPRV
ncbi:glutathione S-transferase family protein [Pseudoalteromonas denitrificans]|uniref:Glutathione S-transferase n=1 Tax=Pseudoalteromonas denitrificans DSM 6059 TaxID=1123010 RepID=A0A1I1IZF8_9GAMM|nr:glutathione S-transferase family protein [Pseudoalteromonas denitrificans]SFC41644.1 glutathione S-transferase [Pseudoalteromonas denitrificans DSM 6059]